MLSTPPHISQAQVANTELLYAWDEWSVEDAYKPADEALVARLEPLSYRANAALTIANAEWVIHRFDAVSDDKMPLEYLEAAWAANVHLAYCEYIETDDDEWRGIIRGPMNIALAIVIDVLFCGDEIETPAKNASWMSNLAELVLPDSSAFLKWRDGCIERLEQHFPAPPEDPDDLFKEQDTGGEPVPREVFDLSTPFDPSRSFELIDRFAKSLDWRTNEFLRHPDDIAEFDDFHGVPYNRLDP